MRDIPLNDQAEFALKLESRHELTVSLAADVARVDESKPAVQFARRISSRRRGGVAAGSRQIEPVEEVEKLSPDIELQPLLEGEAAAQAHVLRDLATPAIVVIKARRGRELTQRGIHPCGRVQYQVLSGIDASAIGVF